LAVVTEKEMQQAQVVLEAQAAVLLVKLAEQFTAEVLQHLVKVLQAVMVVFVTIKAVAVVLEPLVVTTQVEILEQAVMAEQEQIRIQRGQQLLAQV
jgi:hypothetical protein